MKSKIIYKPSDYRIAKYDFGLISEPIYQVEQRIYKRKFYFFGKYIPTEKFKPMIHWIGGGDGYYEIYQTNSYSEAHSQIQNLLKDYFKQVSYITFPIQEIADRWSIAQLKYERSGQLNKEEVNEYYSRLVEYNNHQLMEYAKTLFEINGRIWDLESDIRKGKEEELGLEEAGRRAISIRNLNAERIKIKNKIQEWYDEGFREFKINHASIVEYNKQN